MDCREIRIHLHYCCCYGIIAVLFLQAIYKNEKYKWFLTIESGPVPGCIHPHLFKRDLDFSVYPRCDFHYTVEKMASL